MSSPKGPSPITNYRWGGFVISLETAASWASRITNGKTYTTRQHWAIQNAISPKVRQFKAGFRLIGETREEFAFMVVMRSERLPVGYKKGDPVVEFEEGEREGVARLLLEGEGVTDYVFRTVRMGI